MVSIRSMVKGSGLTWWRPLSFIAAVVLAAGLGIAAFLPAKLIEQYVTADGRSEHAVGLGFVALLAVGSCPGIWRWFLAAGALLSGAVELTQPAVGRSGEWGDFVADLAGLCVGVAIVLLVRAAVRLYLTLAAGSAES